MSWIAISFKVCPRIDGVLIECGGYQQPLRRRHHPRVFRYASDRPFDSQLWRISGFLFRFSHKESTSTIGLCVGEMEFFFLLAYLFITQGSASINYLWIWST